MDFCCRVSHRVYTFVGESIIFLTEKLAHLSQNSKVRPLGDGGLMSPGPDSFFSAKKMSVNTYHHICNNG